MLVAGCDVGGSGARVAVSCDGDVVGRAGSSQGVRLSAGGVAAQDVALTLAELIAQVTEARVDAVAVGITGFVMLGEQLRAVLPPLLGERTGARRVIVASDTLTGYLGARGLVGGSVIMAGTGAVAVGTDLAGHWSRVDGWGHLLGDHGGGSWIGRMGLQAAMRAADGRPGGSPELLKRLRARFGGEAELVALLNAREDRAGLMAAFTPDVVAAADPVALSILEDSGIQLARTALAALLPGAPREITPTGSIFSIGGPLLAGFQSTIGSQARVTEALGSGVDGALLLAEQDITVPGAETLMIHADLTYIVKP